MSITFSDNKYWYSIESSGDWARAEVRELKFKEKDGAVLKLPGKRLCGADTGSGYVGMGSDGAQRRHAPGLAHDFIGTVKLSCDHAASGAPDNGEIEQQMARIEERLMRFEGQEEEDNGQIRTDENGPQGGGPAPGGDVGLVGGVLPGLGNGSTCDCVT